MERRLKEQPTTETYTVLQQAYDHFNTELFDGNTAIAWSYVSNGPVISWSTQSTFLVQMIHCIIQTPHASSRFS
jgi:hypothetical protein